MLLLLPPTAMLRGWEVSLCSPSSCPFEIPWEHCKEASTVTGPALAFGLKLPLNSAWSAILMQHRHWDLCSLGTTAVGSFLLSSIWEPLAEDTRELETFPAQGLCFAMVSSISKETCLTTLKCSHKANIHNSSTFMDTLLLLKSCVCQIKEIMFNVNLPNPVLLCFVSSNPTKLWNPIMYATSEKKIAIAKIYTVCSIFCKKMWARRISLRMSFKLASI